ncbi:unnamed protein product [Bursaphelenchus okinawaensis]|uniref:Carboxylic ester hydrolase n=1 Tax=Bursaphelenchus okinawaensis TaxID=465554 RepID=A0A811KVE8_9BILA|nr:unnamed protein product [Bursaphelenchus okinawaensis]CAG9111927.1 unnamed protein product [Bursaphelenchus okinawaensis]
MGNILSYFYSDFQTEKTDELKINDGLIQGLTYTYNDGYVGSAYMSVPYAKPPVGELRFKKPEASEPWEGIKDCTKLPPRCPHQDMLHEKLTGNISKSEDCLYLNVFLPGTVKRGRDLPVMVYIHGGAFVVHSSSHVGDSNVVKYLCSKEVIVVTLNYRIGIFGFITTSSPSCPGNNAFWDMHKALQWVQDNIHHFGGDKSNVTIFGQSAGGAAVDFLALSPHTQNLFKRYIGMAGTAYSTHSRQTSDRLRVEWIHYAEKVLGFEYDAEDTKEEVDDKLLEFLRSQPSDKMEMSMMPDKRLTINKDGRVRVAPVVDGDFFPKDFKDLRKNVPKKQILLGVTQWEGLLFMLLKPSYIQFARELMLSTLLRYDLPDSADEYVQKAVDSFIDLEQPENSLEHKQQICKVISDVMYNTNMRYLAEESIKNGHEVYMYTFEYCRSNVGGLLGYLFPFRGATHTIELAYLFGRCITSTHFTPSPQDLKVLDRFTNYFTNFAKYGNPNGASEEVWLPITEDELERNMVIKEETDEMQDKFGEGRFKKWRRIWPNIWEMKMV